MTDQEIDTVTYNLRTKLQSLALGVGKTMELRGGENVVLDAEGAQSEVALVSKQEQFYEIAFSASREVYVVDFSSYYTATAADMTLSYNVTRNTDKYGQTADGRKGLYAVISKKVYDSFGQIQSTETICDLELVTGSFKK